MQVALCGGYLVIPATAMYLAASGRVMFEAAHAGGPAAPLTARHAAQVTSPMFIGRTSIGHTCRPASADAQHARLKRPGHQQYRRALSAERVDQLLVGQQSLGVEDRQRERRGAQPLDGRRAAVGAHHVGWVSASSWARISARCGQLADGSRIPAAPRDHPPDQLVSSVCPLVA
jgi:hypothetical protein